MDLQLLLNGYSEYKKHKMPKTIHIIGAGIGGLTTALTLQKRGFDVIIYESSAEIKPVEAGIILASNAMQIFDKLGLKDKIEKAENRISVMKITDEQFNPISVVHLSEYEQKYGVSNIAIPLLRLYLTVIQKSQSN